MIPRGFIASISKPKKDVSDNGEHWGVLYKERIYCNIHPSSLVKQSWINDFYGMNPIEYKEFSVIK